MQMVKETLESQQRSAKSRSLIYDISKHANLFFLKRDEFVNLSAVEFLAKIQPVILNYENNKRQNIFYDDKSNGYG